MLMCASTPPARPSGTITSPAQWSVINSNGVRIRCEARDSGCGIRYVKFRGSYADQAIRGRREEDIGIDSSAPYEIMWNCSHVPDQAWTDLRLRCEIVSHCRKKYTTPSHFILLDRHPGYHDVALHSTKLSRGQEVVVDGVSNRTEPWEQAEAVRLANDDNEYVIQSAYDNEALYLLVSIEDDVFMNRYDTLDQKAIDGDTVESTFLNLIPPVWLDDCISLKFDTKNDKTELLGLDDRMLHITPSGLYYSVALCPRKRKVVIWGRDVRVVFKTADTNDSPMHALAEAAIPWSELGIKPYEGSEIGFQFYVTDRDAPEGERVISSWTGQPHNQNNPSEWGTLILEPGRQPAYLLYDIAGTVVVVLGLGLMWAVRRTRTKSASPDSQVPDPPAALERDAAGVICEQAIRYIEEHLTEPTLNRNAIARHLNLSGPYLSSVFNKKLKTSLPAYVNHKRLEQACRLLTNRNNSISRVALEVGYNTPDHFIRTFKSTYKMTPREFQRRNTVPKPEDQE